MHADRGQRFTHDFLDVLRARAHRFAPAPRGDPAPRGAAAPRFAYITVMVFEPEGWQQTRNFRAGTVKTGDAGFLEACAPIAQQWLLKSGCSGPSCAHHYEVLTNNQTARRDLHAAGFAHNDISLENVLLRGDEAGAGGRVGSPVLCDYGLAQALGSTWGMASEPRNVLHVCVPRDSAPTVTVSESVFMAPRSSGAMAVAVSTSLLVL